MKTTVLAIALAFAAMPMTFAADNPPAKTDSTAKPAVKTAKKGQKDTAKKAVAKKDTSAPASTPAATPVKK
jgi:hypothetical protein